MSYDEARDNVVKFGGFDNRTGRIADETWLWDGQTWTSRARTGGDPPARTDAAIAYDAARQQTVLLGGVCSGPLGGLPDAAKDAANDAAKKANEALGTGLELCTNKYTWIWDGSKWMQKTTTHAPPDRRWHAMTYDARNQKVVLFGGAAASGQLNDTWTWDGDDWTEHPRPPSDPSWPKRRQWTSMAFDGQNVMLFGGVQENNSVSKTFGDTWTWDGQKQKWAEHTFPECARPSARHAAGAAYDGKDVVLFGGGTNDSAGQFQFVNDRPWLWNGSTSTWRRHLDQPGVPRPDDRAEPLNSISSDGTQGKKDSIVMLNNSEETWVFASPTPKTTLVSSPNPSKPSEPVTITARVLPASGEPAPTGKMKFTSDGSLLGETDLVGDTASITTNSLAAGSHSIVASYAAQTNECGPNFSSGTSLPLTQVVVGPSSATAQINIASTRIKEGDSGLKDALIPVSLTTTLPIDVKIDYKTTDATATAPSDYTAKTGSITIAAGKTSAEIPVPIKGDTEVEPDEDFVATLTGATNAAIATAVGRVTIENDDGLGGGAALDPAKAPGATSNTTSEPPATVQPPAPVVQAGQAAQAQAQSAAAPAAQIQTSQAQASSQALAPAAQAQTQAQTQAQVQTAVQTQTVVQTQSALQAQPSMMTDAQRVRQVQTARVTSSKTLLASSRALAPISALLISSVAAVFISALFPASDASVALAARRETRPSRAGRRKGHRRGRN